jgi:hypothetical protein
LWGFYSNGTKNRNWGIKKNSEGKNVFWYGYKGHLAVGTNSQYILESLMSVDDLFENQEELLFNLKAK